MRYELYNIGSTQADYENLLSVFEQLQTDPSPQSVICLERWFDASMCAVLGALLEDFSHVTVATENQNIRSILCKNRFLLQYGEPWEADTYNTTIPYRRCTPEETLSRESIQSVQKLLNLEGFPTTSPSLQRSISQSIFELFDNVRVHSRSPVVCTCGQHYPKKQLIDFVIVDRGIGFYECVREQRPSISNALEAILWALEEGNTTKLSICGGLGLTMLQKFIKVNQGILRIISGTGYYEQSSLGTRHDTLSTPFPGTSVHLQFRSEETDREDSTKEPDTICLE